MRRLLFNLFLLCVSIPLMWAERVDVSLARQVATVMGARMKGNTQLRATVEPELVFIATPGKSLSNLRSSDFQGEADYYVFNYPNEQGFVIVSGEDRAFPVLGYADQGGFSAMDMPENIASWLRAYQDQISEAVKQDWEASASVVSEWNSYLQEESSSRENKEVILKTANWGQLDAYNSYSKGFPEMKDGSGKAITGCVATAMGIIMKYHEYPKRTTSNGVSEFLVEEGTTPIKIDYEGDYDWSKMLMDYKKGEYTHEQAEEVSRLLWHAGVNVKMIYDSYENGGSAAKTSDAIRALVNVFGYSSFVRYLFKYQYDWKEWKQMIRQEIDASRPIMYGNSEHQFVCDGYNDQDYFHMNWGWDGDCNGFYRLSVMSNETMPVAYLDQDMVINIIPKEEGGLLAPNEPFFMVANFETENNKQSLVLSFRYHVYETSDKFLHGMGIIDAQGNVLNVNNIGSCVIPEESIDKNIFFDCKYLLDTSILNAGEMFAPVYSRDQKNWKLITPYLDEDKPFVVGLNKDGLVYRTDADTHPNWPSITKNEFDEAKLTRIEFTDAYLMDEKYHRTNTKGLTFHFPLVGTYEISCEIADYLNWAKHLRVSWGTEPDQMQSLDGEISEEGVFSFAVPASAIQEGNYTAYLKILSDQAGVLPYTLKVHPVVNGNKLDPMLVTKDLAFTISENPTSNDLIVVEENRVWSSHGAIHLRLAQPNVMRVFSISGACVKTETLSAGTTDVWLVPGFYVVMLGDRSYKIVVP